LVLFKLSVSFTRRKKKSVSTSSEKVIVSFHQLAKNLTIKGFVYELEPLMIPKVPAPEVLTTGEMQVTSDGET